MGKKVIGYEQKLVISVDHAGKVHQRMGQYPIFENIGERETPQIEIDPPDAIDLSYGESPNDLKIRPKNKERK